MELPQFVEHIKKLPKAQELANLQARTTCLIQENNELKTQVVSQEAELQGMRALKAATDVELVRAREDRDIAEAISCKFHEFVGRLGDVVNKAQLYDEGSWHQGMPTGANLVRFLVDYNAKMEKLLWKMQTLLLAPAQQPRRPELARDATNAMPTPAVQPEAPQPEAPQPEAPQPEAPQPEVAQPEATQQNEATPTRLVDPILAEPIPDDIVSIKQWAARGLQNLTTPIIGSLGTSLPAIQSTPRSIRKEARRRAEERTKRREEERESETRSSSSEEEYNLPVTIRSFLEDQGSKSPSPSKSEPIPELEEETESLPFWEIPLYILL